MRYIGLGHTLWLPIAVCFGVLSILWFRRVWRQRSLVWAAMGWLACFVAGELPWRLNSRAKLDWLWSLRETYPQDAQKIAALLCWQLSPCLLGILVLAICVEGVRAIRGW